MKNRLWIASPLFALGASLVALPAQGGPQAPSPPPDEAQERPDRGLDRPRRGNQPRPRDPRNEAAGPAVEPGVKVRTDAVQPGYTLYAPIRSTDTYLVDLDGTQVHTWPSEYTPGHSVYLLDDGGILRTCREPSSHDFEGGGQGGRIQKIAWDGSIEWDYLMASESYLQHHDIELMPNGNILAIVWERVSAEDAREQGIPERRVGASGFWPDAIYEINPTGPRSGEIVWRWRSWDHIIQGEDPAKTNFGIPAESPGRIDVSYGGGRRGGDWLHTNAISYNPALDQIALSIHGLNEVWIIDHATTTEEAAGPAGELLYRWGNPAAYGLGTEQEQQLHVQHDVHWIKPGLPGAGDLLVFDNQAGGVRGPRKRPGLGARGDAETGYSAVIQLTPPLQPDGTYARSSGEAFGPLKATWRVDGNAPSTRFYSHNISGAQRLPNGNTLICSGAEGRFLEVTPEGQLCWEFIPPPSSSAPRGRAPDGPRGFGPPPDGLEGPGPPGGPGRRGGRGGPGGGNSIFRCVRILPTHPGLKGHESELSNPPKPSDGSTPSPE